ncbi:MAG: tol-pal system protein YbgF, partial [Desulfobacterales bacterium]
QETDYTQAESACSMELDRIRKELSKKDAMLFDLQSRIQFLEQKNASLEKILAEKELAQTLTSVSHQPEPAPKEKAVPASSMTPEKLYKRAHIFLKKKQYTAAQDAFSSFAQKYSTHNLADNALYWLGECHYTKGQYNKAVHIFNTLRERYPKGEKVPDALLKTGYSYAALGDTSQAKTYFSMLLKTYPFSLAAPKAQARLKELE